MNKVLLLLLLTGVTAFSKEDPKYPVSLIPEDMKTGMYAIIREQEERFEINSVHSATSYYHIVITILNANAKSYARKTVSYDKFTSVKSFHGTAYDAEGHVIKKLKQSEIYDQSAYDGFSMYSDNRLKYADLSQGSYPYTIEYEIEVEEKALFYISGFELYTDDEVSIQKSSYCLKYPAGLKPRYKLHQIGEPKRTVIESKESITWAFENIKPQKFEKFSEGFKQVVPNITVAPVDFEFDGYVGNMSTWDTFGKWIIQLNTNRDVLPEATVQHIRSLTKNASTNEEKIRILYEYMQSKTRYVSIQLGIGGFQPFDAATVDRTGYGDCKALSNYMVAMLKVVGIRGNYVLIGAGEDEEGMDESFPATQFNHAVVAVPSSLDTLWLECTSQTAPLGYAGNFTGNRKALMITDAGAKVVRTPVYTAEHNTQVTSADVFVALTGDATAKINTNYRGQQYENGDLNFILNKQFDDQKKWVQNNLDIPSFDLQNFVMVNHKDRIPSADVKVDLALKRFATVSGKRLFLNPNLTNRSTLAPEKTEQRKTKVVLKLAYTDFDTIRYHLPEGVYPEFLPEPVKIKSRFGEYEASFKVDQGGLVYIRRMRRHKGEYPADSYKELTDFYRSINKADNTKLVFMSKT